jgi:hypothetical protein
VRRSNLDLSRADDRRGHKTFIRYEIDRLTAKPLPNGYYEPGGDLPPEFVSVHHINPHEQKRNESGGSDNAESVSVHGRGVNGQKQKLLFRSVQEIIAEGGEHPEWVVYGFFARGWLTDFVGPAKKSGKTTLILQRYTLHPRRPDFSRIRDATGARCVPN